MFFKAIVSQHIRAVDMKIEFHIPYIHLVTGRLSYDAH